MADLEIFQKLFYHIGVTYTLVLESFKSVNRNFWVIEYWYKTLKCKIWSTKTKPLFWKKQANLETFQKILPILQFPIFFFEVCQKPNSNLQSDWILVEGLKIPNLLNEYKTIFLGKLRNHWYLPKFLLYIGITYKYVLESLNQLSQIFWVIQY